MSEGLIPKHGGYRKLKSFQVSEVVYDLTVRFCEKYVDRFSRTRDQMACLPKPRRRQVQAARSGRQNIAEGSMASATSKKAVSRNDFTKREHNESGSTPHDYGEERKETC